jgi:microcystin-dependent protein
MKKFSVLSACVIALLLTSCVSMREFKETKKDLTTSIADVRQQVASMQLEGLPVGSIVPFGGNQLPEGWMWCNGREISRQAYPLLFNAIGTNWGGTADATFKLPDLRGYFLRGVDSSATVDPEALARTDRNGNTITGARAGTYQNDAFASHNHSIHDPGHAHNYKDHGQGTPNTFDNANDRGVNGDEVRTSYAATTGITIDAAGGRETRPKNAYVNYMIKYK